MQSCSMLAVCASTQRQVVSPFRVWPIISRNFSVQNLVQLSKTWSEHDLNELQRNLTYKKYQVMAPKDRYIALGEKLNRSPKAISNKLNQLGYMNPAPPPKTKTDAKRQSLHNRTKNSPIPVNKTSTQKRPTTLATIKSRLHSVATPKKLSSKLKPKKVKSSGGIWSEKEISSLLRFAAQKQYEKLPLLRKWEAIAKRLPGRSALACRDRYLKLDPSSKKKTSPASKWTQEEIKKLEELVKKHEGNWKLVAAELPAKDPTSCQKKYYKIHPGDPKVWTQEEIDKLNDLVKKHGQNWKLVAADLPGRLEFFCRQEYYKLHPTIKSWDEKDDQKLRKLVQEHGGKWDMIAEHFPGYSPDYIATQFRKYTMRNALAQSQQTT